MYAMLDLPNLRRRARFGFLSMLARTPAPAAGLRQPLELPPLHPDRLASRPRFGTTQADAYDRPQLHPLRRLVLVRALLRLAI